jgi:hypothetical protein
LKFQATICKNTIDVDGEDKIPLNIIEEEAQEKLVGIS